MRRKFRWNRWLRQRDAPLAPKSEKDREHEQGEKTKRRFQDENNRKVKPNAVGICVPEKESRPATANEDECYTAEIQQRRHEQSPQKQRTGAMPEAVASARGLIPGKNNVEGVNGQGSAEDSQQRGAAAAPTPDACIQLGSWLTRKRRPARAQSKRNKDEKENASGELRKKRTSKAQRKPKSVLRT